MTRILIVGATSTIAHACARLWASRGAELFLVARNAARMDLNASDLLARGAAAAHTHRLDLDDLDGQPAMIDACFERLGGVDIALIAHGTLPDQQACERDVAAMLSAFSSNGLSTIALLTRLANRMEAQRSGTVAVISSVAGDRGRPSNYVYGSAKAAVTTFCSGLRSRLLKSGVHVLTIRPGFVDTPMTAGLALPALLVASPDSVARRILSAVERGRDDIYAPGFWRLIMFLIRSVPNALFKRLSL
ncbi:MAG: SDR family oxidoreductase [Lautropia sp.]